MAGNAHVAVDGPVASGKTTVAKLLAKQLGYLYLDTGAMYRSVAFLALRDGVDVDNEHGLADLIERSTIDIVADYATEIGYRVLVDGQEVEERLFAPDVTAVVSTVAAHPHVREALVHKQREIARSGNVVMAGRDIGTVVLPDAGFKFFLTASLDERVRRRATELEARGVRISLERLREQIAERDRLDATRAVAPLRAAPDAVTIDSTGMDPADVLARMLGIIEPAPAR
jgi:cytidylate kinase